MSKPSIDFSQVSKIKPGSSFGDEKLDPAATDKVADRHGFVSRDPVKRVRKRAASDEPTGGLSMRPTLPVLNRFINFSINQRLSYPEALQVLMDRAGLDPDGKIKGE